MRVCRGPIYPECPAFDAGDKSNYSAKREFDERIGGYSVFADRDTPLMRYQ